MKQLMRVLPPQQAHVLLCLPALGQAHVFANLADGRLLHATRAMAGVCDHQQQYRALMVSGDEENVAVARPRGGGGA